MPLPGVRAAGRVNMPRGPKGEKHPADVIGAAVMVAQIEARSTIPETNQFKDSAPVNFGRRGGLKGGKARAAAMSPERRQAIARKAADAA
jgi:hypothetical protein